MLARTTLRVRRYTVGEPDAHGNSATTYSDPSDWLVYAVAPGAMEEPAQSNRDLSVIAWTVYAPLTDDVPTERDLVVLDNTDYAVEGRPKDWTRGPWPSPTAGVVVELRRVEG